MSFHWGYGENNGPHKWGEHWEIAAAPRFGQSPINIEPAKAELKTDWPALDLKYKAERSVALTNNGHSFQVKVNPSDFDDKDDWSFRGGPTKHSYSLAQFHFHWGKTDSEGSEHQVNGKSYAAECHLVHYNRDLFKDAGEAIDKTGGLVVLGILLKPGAANPGIQKLLDHFSKIQFQGDTTDLPDGFDPALLLPKDRQKYWHYYGSLTTPPLYESVNWIVFQEEVELSSQQLAEFRKLHSHTKDTKPDDKDEFKGQILQNYRPALTKDFNTKDKTNGQAKRMERKLFKTA